MKTAFSLFLLLFVSLFSFSKTYHVSPNGSNQTGNGTPNSPWQSITHALIKTQAGDVIQLSEGVFTENEILYLNSVSLIGAGAEKTSLKINHYYDMETQSPSVPSPTGFGLSYDPMPEQAVIQLNGGNMTIKGISLDGQKHKCHIAMRGIILNNAVFDDLKITDFGFTGLWFLVSNNTTVKNCWFENNSWGNDARAFGNILYAHGNNLQIHDNVIIQTQKGSYGISGQDQRKRGFFGRAGGDPREIEGVPTKTVLRNSKFYRNYVYVPERGSWNRFQAPGISIQANMTKILNLEIYDNWVNNHISITPGNANYKVPVDTISCHIHHNIIDMSDMKYRYGIEVNVPHIEIDHNFFIGGLYPIAQWERNLGEHHTDHNIHHNIFYNTRAGNSWITYGQFPTKFRVADNVIFETSEEGIREYFRPRKDFTIDTKGSEIVDNLFFSLHDQTSKEKWKYGTDLENIRIENNLFYNTEVFGNSAKAKHKNMLKKLKTLKELKNLSAVDLVPNGYSSVDISEIYDEMIETIRNK